MFFMVCYILCLAAFTIFEANKIYNELSLFRSPMGPAVMAGIVRWPHFRVPRDTRGLIRDVTGASRATFPACKSHCIATS